MSDRLLRLAVTTQTRVRGRDAQRGDVPGWVMITIMTAGIVVLLWGVAGPKLTSLFTNAMDSVKSP